MNLYGPQSQLLETQPKAINPMKPRQTERHVADIFKFIFGYEVLYFNSNFIVEAP